MISFWAIIYAMTFTYKDFFNKFMENLLNWSLIKFIEATLELRINFTQQRIHCAHTYKKVYQIIINKILDSVDSHHCKRTSCQYIQMLPYLMLRIITFHLTSHTSVGLLTCTGAMILVYFMNENDEKNNFLVSVFLRGRLFFSNISTLQKISPSNNIRIFHS